MGRLRFGVAFAVRVKELEGDHPHSYGKLRTGSSLPPSRGKGQKE